MLTVTKTTIDHRPSVRTGILLLPPFAVAMAPFLIVAAAISASLLSSNANGYASTSLYMSSSSSRPIPSTSSRRGFVSKSIAFTLGTSTASLGRTNSVSDNFSTGGVANAIGPIKIDLINPTYTAAPCPKDKPIPGEKAMKGMRGLCVQVKAELAENSPKV